MNFRSPTPSPGRGTGAPLPEGEGRGAPLIILGAGARAAAGSALRAGYTPWCVDLFADRDLRTIAAVQKCPIDGYPHALLDFLDDAPPAPVLLTGALENHPELIEAIAAKRPLLGSSPAAVRLARDPAMLAGLPPIAGVRYCPVWLPGQIPDDKTNRDNAELLIKPLASAAGRGISRWPVKEREPVPPGHAVQRFIPGTPLGALYTMTDHELILLGVTEQIIGDTALGARPYHYAGSLGPADLSAVQITSLRHVGESIAQRCGLQGLFGIDLICDAHGDLWPIEVNPRYTASVEVVEAVTGMRALRVGNLKQRPKGSLSAPARTAGVSRASGVCGKAIVFARHACTVSDLYRWFAAEQIADVPEIGDTTPVHRPICTFLARAENRAACLRGLHEMAAELYTRLEQ